MVWRDDGVWAGTTPGGGCAIGLEVDEPPPPSRLWSLLTCEGGGYCNGPTLRQAIESGGERDVQEQGLVHLAALKSPVDVLFELLRAGAPWNSVDGEGKTPFLLACRTGQLLNVLLLYGVGGRECLKWTDPKGRNGMHFAVQSASKDVPEVLFCLGVDAHLRDKGGISPIALLLLQMLKPGASRRKQALRDFRLALVLLNHRQADGGEKRTGGEFVQFEKEALRDSPEAAGRAFLDFLCSPCSCEGDEEGRCRGRGCGGGCEDEQRESKETNQKSLLSLCLEFGHCGKDPACLAVIVLQMASRAFEAATGGDKWPQKAELCSLSEGRFQRLQLLASRLLGLLNSLRCCLEAPFRTFLRVIGLRKGRGREEHREKERGGHGSACRQRKEREKEKGSTESRGQLSLSTSTTASSPSSASEESLGSSPLSADKERDRETESLSGLRADDVSECVGLEEGRGGNWRSVLNEETTEEALSLLHRHRRLMGILGTQPLVDLCCPLGMGRGGTAPDPRALVWFHWVISSVQMFYWFGKVVPRLGESVPWLGPVSALLFLLSSGTYVGARVMGPGGPEKRPEGEGAVEDLLRVLRAPSTFDSQYKVDRLVTASQRLCPECNVIKGPRCRHCRTCGVCVDLFDHHCPWIGNCVGRRNHAVFVLHLCSAIVLQCCLLWFSWSFLEETCEETGKEASWMSCVVASAFSSPLWAI
eukprot:Cvel_18252.t1-p1 / transcript=Cvel_18252.t1 / gene=Cvel_18252 / organism=Chromera_velia_CCMP2878 / gene_product=Probable palmitoyltransferase ZDHHC12, putative / transcript_product=Probable palmitoyltransferase ZDHHC12, putative / location=Cvel_scaffold1502:735-6735(-) / protein_length=702 / sequence_SO=supercontig / SO=protein_coding / is_pseudo=false